MAFWKGGVAHYANKKLLKSAKVKPGILCMYTP